MDSIVSPLYPHSEFDLNARIKLSFHTMFLISAQDVLHIFGRCFLFSPYHMPMRLSQSYQAHTFVLLDSNRLVSLNVHTTQHTHLYIDGIIVCMRIIYARIKCKHFDSITFGQCVVRKSGVQQLMAKMCWRA